MITVLCTDSALRNRHYFLPVIESLGRNSICKSCGHDYNFRRHVTPPDVYLHAVDWLVREGGFSCSFRPLDLLARVAMEKAKADNIVRSLVGSGVIVRATPRRIGGSAAALYALTVWGRQVLDARRRRLGVGPLTPCP